jgi:hypothetical protein
LLPGLAAAEEEADFNRFDAALCDVLLARFLFDVFATARLLFAVLALPLLLEPFDVLARTGCLDEVLGDFLRDFLNIRLPFVAFGSSIIGYCGFLLANRNRADGWASLTASGYGYKEFDAPPVGTLIELCAQ